MAPDEGVIARKLAKLWPADHERDLAWTSLSRYGAESHEPEVERVRLAILKLSDGQLEELNRMVESAKQDYRDVLMWAEYPEQGKALWSSQPELSIEQQRRLSELKKRDSEQYDAWLRE